ncbi:MAG: vitamin B12-dependent ribonucleotide reductase [Endomicrobium sp.]|nr:vitamin B12-dependent ribonucleotide reductase [Endomicrobium sp.]
MIKLKQNAVTVLQKRYLKKNDKGDVIETPEDLFHRVAYNIALADKLYDKNANIEVSVQEFYTVMTSLDFLPNSPTLINAGQHLQQLSACFVLPIYDSMNSIFETLKNTAIIHKSGGGTGFSFSRLRPKNDTVKTTNGISSGPISFMHVFNAATEAIKQGGVRRGANMGILRIDHPDILDFITCKEKNTDLNNFNISVAITKKFMDALEKNSNYALYNPRTASTVGQLNAKEVFNKIVKQAWTNGEPGVIFIDRINEKNTLKQVGVIESTNPCGEQPLLPYESCNLGSINLGNFIKEHDVDWTRLEKTIKIAVHFLDNVIDMNKYPMKQIAEITLANRKIGLGIMGWADMLLYLNIPYGSEESYVLGEKIMRFIQIASHKASEELANHRGAFPNFSKSIYSNGKPIRNATTTTIAPTGTISIIASASSGIEPIFALVYKRNQCLDNTNMYEVNSYFEYIAQKNGFYSQDLLSKIVKEGTIQSIQDIIPEHIRKIFVTSHDISSEQHVRMQAIFQKFTDNAVSKTVNLPHYANKHDVENIYLLAYKMNCKGITVYRDKSRDVQVLNLMSTKVMQACTPRNRPSRTIGSTFLMCTGCGKMYVTVNEDCVGICEVFSQLGKSGGCTASQAEAISRLVSLSLRSGIDKELIIKQLKGIRCPAPTLTEGGTILSCADAVAKALEAYSMDYNKKEHNILNIHKDHRINKVYQNDICPQCQECGEMLTFLEGCVTCTSCGYSRCS